MSFGGGFGGFGQNNNNNQQQNLEDLGQTQIRTQVGQLPLIPSQHPSGPGRVLAWGLGGSSRIHHLLDYSLVGTGFGTTTSNTTFGNTNNTGGGGLFGGGTTGFGGSGGMSTMLFCSGSFCWTGNAS